MAAFAAILTLLLLRSFQPRPIILRGAVMVRDADPNQQQPIADVEVTGRHRMRADRMGLASFRSRFRGGFGRDRHSL
jgi:hypothetical protein